VHEEKQGKSISTKFHWRGKKEFFYRDNEKLNREMKGNILIKSLKGILISLISFLFLIHQLTALSVA